MGSLRKNLGRRIRQLRKAARLTQGSLARRAGMDARYISAVENGNRNITVDTLERIVTALPAEPYELFLFESGEPRRQYRLSRKVLDSLIRETSPSLQPVLIRFVQSLHQVGEGRRKE